jgi:glycosyltransferase involved in cell wall biosynthesis
MRILMVSTEYPPMPGGVGRYTHNLTCALRTYGDRLEEIFVACDENGKGDYAGAISPSNSMNSENLLRIVRDAQPDLVHVQFEPGLYGLFLDPVDPKRSMTYIDAFYRKCHIPIVTTFHSAYTIHDWIERSPLVKRDGKTGIFGIPARMAVRLYKEILNYNTFYNLSREKLRLSGAGIGFSKFLLRIVGGGHLVYHGAEPVESLKPIPTKKEARERMGLPQEKKLAVAVGFRTVTKGWDILEKLQMPEGWAIVVNSSKGHYSKENIKPTLSTRNSHIIDLQQGFLSDVDLSTLLLACDIVVLPYRVASGSGVMFDALGHGLPFVASNLEFFKEFAAMGLGRVTTRDPKSFVRAISEIEKHYDKYSSSVEDFRQKLKWEYVTRQHVQIYTEAIEERKRNMHLPL